MSNESLNGSRVPPMRVLFALPGLHRVHRGAEIAFESVASRLAERSDCQVTLVGSGQPRQGQAYRFMHVPCRPREKFERWPRMPVFRDHYVYEEFSFARRLWSAVDPSAYDVTVACSYPFLNWMLRARRKQGRPRHVFVTQNGDWAARANQREYKYFACDGLVCTNPEYLERNRERWRCELIPNGVDVSRFRGVTGDRAKFDLPANGPVALIVSALIPSKRVVEGVSAAARVPGLSLLVLGDGELRDQVDAAGRELMPGRFRRISLPYDEMPIAYASADVLLHMSKDEPFGNVYIEALAAGLPVVVHDWAGTRWILGAQGTLVDTDQPVRVAEAIQSVLNNNSKAAANARRSYVESRFGWATIAGQYAAFFRRVLEAVS